MSGDKDVKRWPGHCDQAYPEVFTTIPTPQPDKVKPGQFTQEQLKQFFQDGFVQVDDFFSRDELEPVREDTKVLVEELAQKLYKAGKITKLYQEYSFFQRLTMMEKEFPGTNILLHKIGVLPKAYRTLWANERLLNLMEQLLGTRDIQGNPVWNLRTKTPKNTATTVPWHQDSAYLDKDSYGVMMCTAWIPLLDSNEQNGCMQMVRGGHRKGEVATHTCCWRDTWYIMLDEQEMEKSLDVDTKQDIVTCAVPYGGALFFSNMIPHRSLNNLSDDIRWSLDLRWQRLDKPIGFYGMKDGVQMTSSTDPDFKIDWDTFDSLDRQKLADEDSKRVVADEFDTVITGPWMRNWEMVNTNRHTEALEKEAAEKQTQANR